MELSITYVMSQILVVIYYIIYSFTFNMKSKKKILFTGIVATVLSAISYLLLNAYTGIAMCFVAIIRNIWFDKSKNKFNLITILLITIAGSILTYQNIFSLLNVLATIIYTYSLWQVSTKKYKLLGIFVNFLMIIYDFSINSIMGVIFMFIAFISSVMGYIKECKGSEKNVK